MSKEATKVVVRLLPPEISEEQITSTFNDVHLKSVSWSSFQAGKRYKGEAKPARNARMYLQFTEHSAGEAFIKDYHGHQIVDSHGETFRAVACWAPYQKVPRSKPSKDARDGTIEDDAYYTEFLENMNAPKAYVAPPNPKDDVQIDPSKTPLLEHMKKILKEKKLRAEKKAKKWSTGRDSYSGMEKIEEGKSWKKWRCSECGTSKNLEEDPGERGVFYCTDCWESWESEAPKKKKKKKKGKDDYEDYQEEDYSEESSKKSKKKKKNKDKDGESWDQSGWGEGYYEEEQSSKKEKKKKKSKDESYDDGWTEDSGWSYKDGSYWEEGDKKKSKKKKKDEDSWWDDYGWDEGSSKSGSKDARWKAKDGAEEGWSEDKPKKSKKEKKDKSADDDASSRWAPKSRK
eukprot:TRINITY_DN20799_c0_g1_i1.p1 TRINITY_DN20799_c0_g1~~TRINITY_DN20799_c0_g1_i1.p1  ORF type:complete len:401 (+),score=151.60 TRINITY_DN20799_c0_g1_i1:150-1352(+)